MSIEKEYYLSCIECSKAYHIKCDDAQSVEDEALDDGWAIIGEEDSDVMEHDHICPECLIDK